MAVRLKYMSSLSQAEAKPAEFCEEVRTKGTEDIITRNDGSRTSMIDADRLDHYHRLEREMIHIGLLEEAIKGVSDLNAKRTLNLAQLKARHGR